MPNLGIIMLVMGIKRTGLPASQNLFNKTRRGLLALLYGHTEKEYYINQMMGVTRIGARLMASVRKLRKSPKLVPATLVPTPRK